MYLPSINGPKLSLSSNEDCSPGSNAASKRGEGRADPLEILKSVECEIKNIEERVWGKDQRNQNTDEPKMGKADMKVIQRKIDFKELMRIKNHQHRPHDHINIPKRARTKLVLQVPELNLKTQTLQEMGQITPLEASCFEDDAQLYGTNLKKKYIQAEKKARLN